MSKQVNLFKFLKRAHDESEPGPSASTSVSDRLVSSEPKSRKPANRKYSPEYLKYGFTFKEDGDVHLPQCVVCSEVLCNEAMKPAKLMRHFETKHKELVKKPLDFFKRKETQLKNAKQVMKQYSSQDKAALKASFLISLKIAKAKKPFTIGEDLILPCIFEATKEVLGEESAKKMKNIALSNNTVTRRIESMAADVENQLIIKLHQSKWFSLQLDESTDVTNKAILLVYVKYIDHEETKLNEEYMTSIELPGHTKGRDIFNAVDGYLKLHKLSWKDCVGLCTDGAAAMTGYKQGLKSFVLKEAGTEVQITHCIIHREMLATKQLSPELNEVLLTVVKAVNLIRSKALNSRLFATLCDDMGSLHSKLLLHTEVRWLSRGRVLARFYELREEVCMFLDKNNPELAAVFRDGQWVAKLAFLTDIFEIINVLNLGLQGPSHTVFDLWKKIAAFKQKLKLWQTEVEKGSFAMFNLFSEFIIETEGMNINKEQLSSLVKAYIASLQGYFDNYFPASSDVSSKNLWVANPFLPLKDIDLTLNEQEELIEISSDPQLEVFKIQCDNIASFWIKLLDEYQTLSQKALKILLPFNSTYLCETAFSTLNVIKNKHRNSLLKLDAPFRLSLTSLKPNIEDLASKMQNQGSH